MGLQCGIIGLPNVGKSTIFNALTKANIPAENYPFCTIDPNVGIVKIPDSRLNKLAEIYNPKKITPANVQFIDIAGLVSGASQGEGLGNQFLGQIRQAQAIIHVVRCYEDSNITHVEGVIDPIRDAELIETELLLADIQSLEKRVVKIKKQKKNLKKESSDELDLLLRLIEHCNNGSRALNFFMNEEEFKFISELHLLTIKPILYVANIDEKELIRKKKGIHTSRLVEYLKKRETPSIEICGKLEHEISVLSKEEKKVFLKEYNLLEPSLNKLIRAGFKMLGLGTFFTGGPNEVKAWTLKKGSNASLAAKEIHSDIQRGFIKAEIIKYKELEEYGSERAVKDAGLARLEGRDYIVNDGDCIFFHFNI